MVLGRPQAQPNYGFIKQLDIFENCGYEPSLSHPQYRSWKRRHVQDVNNYLNHLVDTVAIVPDKLLMTRFVFEPITHLFCIFLKNSLVSEFPNDPEKAQSLLIEMGVTHLLSISPAENTSSFASVMNHHVGINSQSPEALLLVLPSICDYIRDSVKNNGLVLVHCQIESRACMAVCAYRKCFPQFKTIFHMRLVMSGGSSYEQAFCVIQNGQFNIILSFLSLIDSLLVLPLFNPTKIFLRSLERFQASLLMVTSDHLTIVNDTFSSQRQSNAAAAAAATVTKSSNVHDRNESQHTTTSAATTTTSTSGRETDSGALGDFINLKMAATRQTFISVR